MNFDDRCVMVTGAAGNLGRAVARAFAARGAALVLVDSRAANLQRAFGGESDKRLFAPVDLLDPASVEAAVSAASDACSARPASRSAPIASGLRSASPPFARIRRIIDRCAISRCP